MVKRGTDRMDLLSSFLLGLGCVIVSTVARTQGISNFQATEFTVLAAALRGRFLPSDKQNNVLPEKHGELQRYNLYEQRVCMFYHVLPSKTAGFMQ